MVRSSSKKSNKQALQTDHFVETNRLSPKAFLRHRVLTFQLTVLFLLNFVKGSLQDEVDQLFQAILKLDVSKRMVTRSAMCQAWAKLSHKVFIGLLDIVCRFLNRWPGLQTYKGLRVFAMDGSTLVLPDREPLRDSFGVAKYAKDAGRAIARVSILHDVLNRVTYDAIIDHYRVSEQTMAWEHLETAELPPNSLFLLERGYISFHLLRHFLDHGHGFCVRIKANLNVVKQLEASGHADGVFRMGAPETEPERRDNERQHLVYLTRPFWLAETTCTQALWHAGTEANPSHFKGDDLPVETVSWNDVADFLQKLNRDRSGSEWRLPTEAEWEYACRAGTTTPFSTGLILTTDQANYDGNHPYAGSTMGKFRKKTVTVREMPANRWGLYQMHGNVWEWCSDWYGEAEVGPVLNPAGPDTGAIRVLRGGS